MKAPHETRREEPASRSVAQRAHNHHANSAAGPSQGAPFEEDLSAPLVQRKARMLESARAEHVSQLQTVANRSLALRSREKHPA